ncbi:MAG TPA: N-acetylglucosamine-6-phosphate deacetylase [Longimicrobiales bacterium]
MSSSLLIENCRLYNAVTAGCTDIRIEGGRIAAIGGLERGQDAERLDAGGRTVIPGLIDIHVHGAGGADTQDGTPEALETISRSLARLGTTSFLATTLADPATGNRHLPVLAEGVEKDLGGADLLGIYIEGPFVSVEKRGGIPTTSIVPPSRGVLEEILALTGGTLRIMTIAPELDGSLPLIERLVAAGVIPAFGHSAASYEQAKLGIEAGIRHVTHLYNAMTGLHHRSPGPLVAFYEAESIPLELISDDVHVNRHTVRWTSAVFGVDRLVCITDGLRMTGLPDGFYRYNGRECEARQGAARYLDGTLIGTSLGLLEIALRFREYTGSSFAAAIDAASIAPARALGLEHRKGSIEVGKDADLVILDPDDSVWATVVAGKVVYRK